MSGAINNYDFVGNLSCNQSGDELKSLKKYISDHFKAKGGMVITYSKKEEIGEDEAIKMAIERLSSLWDLDMEALNKEGRLFFLCRDFYTYKDGEVELKKLRRAAESRLDSLVENGYENNMIYVDVDDFWSGIKDEDYEYAYSTMKYMAVKGDARFLLRYIGRKLNEKQLSYLLKFHECIFVDGGDDFEVYTRDELVYDSLALKAKYNSLERDHNKEMQRVEHLKTLGELLEAIIHDINNLLSTISGYAQLSLSIENLEDIESYLEIINRTALDGRNLIEKIRSYRKEGYHSEKDYYSLDEIVEDSISMTDYRFKSQSIISGKDLKLHVDLKSEKSIHVNEYELRQLILNLILNGVDAMSDGGVLTIRTYDKDHMVFLEVEDTGEGIEEDIIGKIFDPYFTTKGSEGTGLGLNIVRKIVKDYGGSINVHSKFDEGSKFTIALPSGDGK